MVFIGGQKLACATCIKGHRSSSCNHTDRPLFAIRPKGRPVSQCEHCRELRKTKQVHVKCECDTKPSISPAALNGNGPETTLIVARKGARKIKTLEPATATFPNGIQDMVEAAQLLSGMGDGAPAGTSPTSVCTCGTGGTCNCWTERYVSKKQQGEGSSKGHHANRPSISLTIPPNSDPSPSSPGHGRSPSITITPSGGRSHSRSPSRSHRGVEGHQVGGGQSTRHEHGYSPYSAGPALPYGLTSDLRSPGSSGSNSHNQSPGAGQPSAVPNPNSPILLYPGSNDIAYDLSNPSSPLSVDFDRPHSALSIHTGSAGRTTPIDFGTPGGQIGDWSSPTGGMGLSPSQGMSDGMQALNLMSGNSPVLSPLDQLMAQSHGQFSGYRPQDSLSPASPGTPHYLLSPDANNNAQTSPTSFGAPGDMTGFGMPSAYGDFQQGAINAMLMQENNTFPASGRLSPYSDVFEDGDISDPFGMPGNRSRRGSHQSVSSSHSGHGGHLVPGPGPAFRISSASPSMTHGTMPGELNLADMALMDPENPANKTCANAGQGCHCWSATGQPAAEGERCNGPNCACCSYVATTRGAGALAGLGLDAFVGGANSPSKFAVSGERDASTTLAALGAGLQIPAFVNRTRSDSNSSTHSHASLGSSAMVATPNTGLSRANSTGQIGRGKFKPILPKPSHGASASMSYQTGSAPFTGLSLQPQARTVRSNPASAGPSSPSVLMSYPGQFPGDSGSNTATSPGNLFTFPRPATAEEIVGQHQAPQQQQPSPAVIVTEPPPNEFSLDPNSAESFKQMMQASFTNAPSISAPSSPQDPFNTAGSFTPPTLDPSSSSSSLFEAAAAVGSNPRHSRNHSQPNSFATGSTSPFLQEPKPLHYGHARSSSASLLDGRSSIEVIVTPASPFNPPGLAGSGSTSPS